MYVCVSMSVCVCGGGGVVCNVITLLHIRTAIKLPIVMKEGGSALSECVRRLGDANVQFRQRNHDPGVDGVIRHLHIRSTAAREHAGLLPKM